MNKKSVGIIGGMGPLATADLFKKIVLNTKAESDQEHIRVLIDNNTDIPDHTQAIISDGKSTVHQLVKSAISLCNMGAQLLVMPCNTAHFFHSEVQEFVDVPILNMIELTRDALLKKGIKKAGLLATEGTINSGIYQKIFETSKISLITPENDEQKVITDMIYKGVKAGNKDYDVKEAKEVFECLPARGAQVLILGCTELLVAVSMYNLEYPVCDPTSELAKGAIIASGGECI